MLISPPPKRPLSLFIALCFVRFRIRENNTRIKRVCAMDERVNGRLSWLTCLFLTEHRLPQWRVKGKEGRRRRQNENQGEGEKRGARWRVAPKWIDAYMQLAIVLPPPPCFQFASHVCFSWMCTGSTCPWALSVDCVVRTALHHELWPCCHRLCVPLGLPT